jgi:hypothetical protein
MNLKKLNVVFVALMLVLSSPASAAKGKWTKLKNADVYFKLPSKWKSVQDLLGLPLVLYSPMKDRSRITISVTPTGLKKKFLLPKDLADNQEDYRKGRRRYIKEIQGEITSFFPYETRKWANVERVHTIGFKYVLGGQTFVERTYYFTCKTQMFNMKSKYREEEFPEGKDTVKKIVESFNCR